MSCKNPRFALFIDDVLKKRDMTVGDAQMLCIRKVKEKRWYAFLKGTHIPTSQELKHIEHRMSFDTPEHVFDEVGYERLPIKSRQMELKYKNGRHVWTI